MRSVAREVVYQYIFSKEFNKTDDELFNSLLKTLDKEEDKNFAKLLIQFVEANDEEYNNEIKVLSQNFKFDRILKSDLCAIKLGMAEYDNFVETPIPVIVDEAVKIAVKFSTEKSPDFVNGVLGKYISSHKREK